jgi:hypothetical protein
MQREPHLDPPGVPEAGRVLSGGDGRGEGHHSRVDRPARHAVFRVTGA